jgi:hypothetical protein
MELYKIKNELALVNSDIDDLQRELMEIDREIDLFELRKEIINNDIKEKLKEAKNLEVILKEGENNKTKEMIDKLKEMGFIVLKKDKMDKVCFNVRNQNHIFGVSGILKFNDSKINEEFNDESFKQLYNKGLLLDEIHVKEIENDGEMADFIKSDGNVLLDVIFLSLNNVPLFSKEALVRFEKPVKHYNQDTLEPYYKMKLMISEYKPYL